MRFVLRGLTGARALHPPDAVMPLRIVIAVQHFPPGFTGGVEIYSEWIAKALGRAGHDVLVVALEDMFRPAGAPIEVRESDHAPGVRVLRLSMLDEQFWTFEASVLHRPLKDWFAALLREVDPDIVHIQGGYRLSAAPLIAARAHARARVVVTLHDYWYACPTVNLLDAADRPCSGAVAPETCVRCTQAIHTANLRGAEDWMARTDLAYHAAMTARSALMRRVLAGVDLVLSPTDHLAETYLGAGFRFPNLRIVRLGLDPSLAAPRRNTGAMPAVPTIGFIGTLLYHKGAHVLAEAVTTLHASGIPVRCVIYGATDSPSDYVTRLLGRYVDHPAITFGGGYPIGRLTAILQDIDAVAVPSLWAENSPLVALSALANATPVIASDIGAMKEFVRPEVNGLLCVPGSATSLAEAIESVCIDVGMLRGLAQGARYDRTSAEEADDLTSIYQQLMLAPRRA
ncbi:hypothetical protein AVM11_11965 [Sphingomonas melonis TY]|uniref:Glycosyltransferase subfamily 4-like N-terminal domain-containing protein n=1 Tax=Sphingomonas melonis TY TaxID=621456 RepID=A0A175XZH4_9SPHN|nr:hypothetical protein AVM11_11965 [Sphingomonas melonis TY]